MREFFLVLAIGLLILLLPQGLRGEDMNQTILPKPVMKGSICVEEAIKNRRSVRSYSSKDVSLEYISQLLWACQGITDESRGLRASPSAGALYPLEIYLVKKDGVFHYIPDGHKMKNLTGADVRPSLAKAAYGQGFVAEAPICIVITAIYERISSKYGNRGVRYTDMEAGHAAENVFLEAVSLGLDSVAVGAFSDDEVARVLNLPKDTKPLYILPVGYKK